MGILNKPRRGPWGPQFESRKSDSIELVVTCWSFRSLNNHLKQPSIHGAIRAKMSPKSARDGAPKRSLMSQIQTLTVPVIFILKYSILPLIIYFSSIFLGIKDSLLIKILIGTYIY